MRLPAHLLTPEEVTQEIPITTVTFVGKSWPVDSFRAHLRALMDREEIADFAELWRLSGVSQTQLSNWNRGISQPSQASLDKLAPVLQVAERTLYIAAGLMTASQLGTDEVPELTVLPREFDDLVDLYRSASEANRRIIREQIAFAVRGLRALIDEPAAKVNPSRRRTA